MSADFTPEKEDLKILTPFKMQVLTNFPYIEADFDALTNYQLLCKVVEYLNAVIHNENEVTEQVTGLYNAYVALQNYVNTYFDSLDLQSIVDNKLDEMAEDGTLADIVAEYVRMQGQLVYNTVADMKAAENIQNGSFLKTYGYYTVGDHGGALYKARTITNEDVIDNSSIIALHDVTLVAELIPETKINIRQFGIYEDKTHDDTEKLQNLINYAYNKELSITGNFIRDLSIGCKITGTLKIPYSAKIENINFSVNQGSYTNSYVIYINVNNSYNDWEVSYPSLNKGYLKNCNFKNETANTYNCIYNYANNVFENLSFNNFDTFIKIATKYLDSWKLVRIFSENKIGSNYGFDLGTLGDQCEVDTLHYYGTGSTLTNAIIVRTGHNGIILKNIICHGKIVCEGSIVSIENLHMEHDAGRIEIDNSIVTLKNGYIYHNLTESNIEIKNNGKLKLENVKFRYNLAKNETTDNENDITVTSGDLECTNVYKSVINPSDIGTILPSSIKTNLGISCSPDFTVSTLYSYDLKNNQTYNNNRSVWNSGTANYGAWQGEAGTYYYAAKPMADFERLIQYENYTNRPSVTVSDTSKCVYLNGNAGFWRIYRGTTENTFSEYVDICSNSSFIIDNYTSCNGYKWKSRTPGNVDACYNFRNYLTYTNKNVITYGAAKPTNGTWKKGDIIYKTTVANNDPIGWLCVTDGTPGTWIPLATYTE